MTTETLEAASRESVLGAAMPDLREPDASPSRVSVETPRRVKTQIPELDGVRGLAILLVLFYHETVLVPAVTVDRVLQRMTSIGWCGVDVFFVLSGFLITGILLDSRRDKNYFRNFYVRRVLRIFPLYYGVLVFSLLLLPHFPHPKLANFGRISGDELWYWTYLSNVIIALRGAFRHGILDVSWSLAIEEQFYLIWPFMVALLSPKRLFRVCIAVIVCVPLLRYGMIAAGFNPIAVYVLTPSRVDGLAAGAALAVLWRDGHAQAARRWLGPAAACAGGGIGLLWLTRSGMNPLDPIVEIVGFSLFVIVFSWVVTIAVTAEPTGLMRVVMRSSWLRFFGKYSYAMYLFHLPLRAAYRDTIFGPRQFSAFFGSQTVGQLLFFCVATATTAGFAWLSWNLYEKRFLALKAHFE